LPEDLIKTYVTDYMNFFKKELCPFRMEYLEIVYVILFYLPAQSIPFTISKDIFLGVFSDRLVVIDHWLGIVSPHNALRLLLGKV
jgi:hypothetical protein